MLSAPTVLFVAIIASRSEIYPSAPLLDVNAAMDVMMSGNHEERFGIPDAGVKVPQDKPDAERDPG